MISTAVFFPLRDREMARMGLSLVAHRTGMLGLSCSQVCEPVSQQAIPSPADKRTCPGRQSPPSLASICARALVMDDNPRATSLERAFELARSGRYANIDEIKRRLKTSYTISTWLKGRHSDRNFAH
jgi:hypothetical protein